MRRGWFGQSYRHYLASKGVKTVRQRYQEKFPDLVKDFPGENPRITDRYARFRQEDPSKFELLRTIDPGRPGHTKLVVGRLKGKKTTRTQSVLVDRKGYFALRRPGMWVTDESEGAAEYADRNLRSSVVGDRVEHFKNGVRKTLFHPKQDLDEEWEEYTAIKTGVPEPLSADPLERSVQRGAALFGRVTTMANVEPFVDSRMERSFRDLSMDFVFGRKED